METKDLGHAEMQTSLPKEAVKTKACLLSRHEPLTPRAELDTVKKKRYHPALHEAVLR